MYETWFVYVHSWKWSSQGVAWSVTNSQVVTGPADTFPIVISNDIGAFVK